VKIAGKIVKFVQVVRWVNVCIVPMVIPKTQILKNVLK